MALALAAAGCGSSDESLSVKEGEPVTVDDLSYNVAITRFLNPADQEDQGYLTGQPDPPAGKSYLAVFLQVTNQGDALARLPKDFTVTDTSGDEFAPIDSNSLFALELGGKLKAGATAPQPESTAASGPIEGSMILFRVNEDVTESRPLVLDIPSTTGGESGEVELDI